MLRAVMLTLLLTRSAFGLTLTPMLYDDIATHDHFNAVFSVYNGAKNYQEYTYQVDLYEVENGVSSGEFGVAGESAHTLQIPIFNIEPDKLTVYRVCVQERPSLKSQVSLRMCARLRLYWPRSVLSPQ